MKHLLIVPLLTACIMSMAQNPVLNEKTSYLEVTWALFETHWVCTGDTIKYDTISDGSVRVQVSGFWACCVETPQVMWDLYSKGFNRHYKIEGLIPSDSLPITNITTSQIDTFLTNISETTRKKWRLPTKEEWLFMYHGGLFGEGYSYAGSNRAEWVAWYSDNSGGKKHTVGERIANELGIHDMLGNVAEYVWDGDTLRPMGGCYLDPNPAKNVNHLYTTPPPEACGFRIVATEPQWFFIQ